MAEYDVPFPRISIVRTGKDPVPSALGSNDGVVITIPDSGNLASALCARADIANARSVRLALGTDEVPTFLNLQRSRAAAIAIDPR
jgi:hypothetical protein